MCFGLSLDSDRHSIKHKNLNTILLLNSRKLQKRREGRLILG